MTSQNTTAQVPAPAGAASSEWDSIDGHLFRCLNGQQRGRDGVTVAASAIQLGDGSIDSGAAVAPPVIFVAVSGDGISVEQARELAGLLLAAAAEVDGWRDQCGGDAGQLALIDAQCGQSSFDAT